MQVSAAIGPLSAAINSWVHRVAPQLRRALRVNVVSPAPIVEPGSEGTGRITAAQAAEFYLQAVNSDFAGRTVRAWGGLPAPEVIASRGEPNRDNGKF